MFTAAGIRVPVPTTRPLRNARIIVIRGTCSNMNRAMEYDHSPNLVHINGTTIRRVTNLVSQLSAFGDDVNKSVCHNQTYVADPVKQQKFNAQA